MRPDSACRGGAIFALLLLAGCAGNSARQQDTERLVETNLGLAQSYMGKHDYEIALDKLKKAEAADPRSAMVQSMLGLLYEEIKRPEQAGEHYDRSVKLSPDQGAITNNYGGWLCRSGRAAESLRWFDRAVDDPFYKTPELALANAGRCAAEAGSLDRAAGYFRRVLELQPNDAQVLVDMAMLSFRQGDLLRARAFVQRRESLGPLAPEQMELAAKVEQGLGDVGAAQRYRALLLEKYPEYPAKQPE